MSVVVIGLNHRTAPLDVLERAAVPADRLAKVLADLGGRTHVSEAVVLSTCNRTEIYVVAERFHGAFGEVRDFLGDHAGLPIDRFAQHLYSLYDDAAVDHLFRVAAGLDSVVVGESEILGQIRQAWETALAEGTARSVLNGLFRHALEVGKRARTDTGIGRSATSVATVAVDMAKAHLGGSLAGRRVLVIGAGEMGEQLAETLAVNGAAVVVANRTRRRAEQLARAVGGSSIGIGDIGEALVDVDVLLTSTGSDVALLDPETAAHVMTERRGRPLLVVDVAVPRDVDPAVSGIDGITRLDLDDLREFAAEGVARRRAEAVRVEQLVVEEVERYRDAASARQVAPLVAQLRSHAEAVRRAELDRFSSRLAGLDERQREAVEALTKGLVAKLLHEPSVRLKDAAATPRGERLAASLRELFDL